VALASGGLAASRVREHERSVAEQVGQPVEVVVATRDLPAGGRVSRAALGLRTVPARYVPPDALASGAGIVGARLAAPVPAGGYLTASAFEGGEGGGERDRTGLGRGERAVTVEVTGGPALDGLAPMAPVDVLVSTEPGATGGRTAVALAGVELLHLGESAVDYEDPDPAAAGSTGPTALATLRLTLRQAVYLTAADNFAREIRLLARPPGDDSRAGTAVSAADL
jgi:pilus assembly protein CpaB